MSYAEYRQLLDELFRAGKTTGETQNEDMRRYAELNIARMNKWDKHFQPENDVAAAIETIEKPEIWLVITEGWCGDAAHALPVMAKLAELSGKVEMKIVLRDEHLDLMDLYLTNGARGIPKLIRLDAATFEVIQVWGPRPEAAAALVKNAKVAGQSKEDFIAALQIWYARDRGKSVAREIAEF